MTKKKKEPAVNPYLVPDEQFNGYLDQAIAYIEGVLEKGDCVDFIPTMMVYGHSVDNDTRVLYHCLLANFNMEKRHETLRQLGAKFARDGILAVCIIFLTEAWQSVAPLDEANLEYPRVMPRDDPNRIEIVQAAGLTYDQRSSMGRVVVTRDKKNNMVMGKKEVYYYGGDVKMENVICRSFYQGQAQVLVSAHF